LSNGAFPEKKQSSPEIFHCIEYTFYIQEFWATCVCPEKQRVPEFTVLNIFFIIQDFEQLALALKNRVALKFFTVLKYFLSFRIFEQLALALKKRVALKIFIVWNILFTFRIFEQFALVLKSRVCPRIFHCIEYVFFIIQDFWATCACPLKKQSCPENFHCIELYFII